LPTDYERDAHGLERSEFVTANCFVSKRGLERLGGFDERFPLAWREDSDLHFRLLRVGARLAHAPGRQPPAAEKGDVRRTALQEASVPVPRAHPRWDYYLIVVSLIVAASVRARPLNE
jgi:hypothetical protein